MENSPAPAISVILPTFNRASFLPQAFDSIRSQICTDWELVVVDDGSTDDTRRVVERLQREVAQPVRYVHQINRGAYAARNTGVSLAAGEFVAFFDSDDLWLPHHMSDCLAAFRAHPELDWVYGPCRRIDLATGRLLSDSSFYVDGKPRPFLRAKTRTVGELHILEDPRIVEYQILHGLYCGLQNSVIRRKVFADRRFCEKFRIAEDEFFLVRALGAGARVAYFMKPHFIYRVHDDNSSASSEARPAEKMLPIFQELVDGFEQLGREMVLTRRQKRALRRRLSREYFWHLGYHGLWRSGRQRDAVVAFRHGLSLCPWDISLWKTYLVALARMYTGQFQGQRP